jgi:2-polyprenyl-3-methyl-5-hydroxy-6-metoxy-1,4-benzoquinol methylase
MFIENIWLNDIRLSEDLLDIKHRFEQEYQSRYGRGHKKGLYNLDDWLRISFCQQYIRSNSGSILDVGVGPGALLNVLHSDKYFSQVTGIDIRHYTKLVKLYEDLDIQIMNVTEMTFSDNEFDTVVCMEVLEHIGHEQFIKALKQLRRVTAKCLFMTVPFCESLPLSPYHKLRFDFNDINFYFPNGKYYLLVRRKGVPWMVIVEYFENC